MACRGPGLAGQGRRGRATRGPGFQARVLDLFLGAAAAPRVLMAGGAPVSGCALGSDVLQWQRPGFCSDLLPGLGQVIALGASVSSSVRRTQQRYLAPGPLPNALQAGARLSTVPAEGKPGGEAAPGAVSDGLSPQTPAQRTACGSEPSRAGRLPSGCCGRPSAGSSSPCRSRALSTRWPCGRPRPRRARGHAA